MEHQNPTQELLNILDQDAPNNIPLGQFDINLLRRIAELLNEGADPNAKYPDGTTILTKAFRHLLEPNIPVVSVNIRFKTVVAFIGVGALLSPEDKTPEIKTALKQIIIPSKVDLLYLLVDQVNDVKKEKILGAYEMVRHKTGEHILENMEDLRDYMGAKGGRRKQGKSKKQNKKQNKKQRKSVKKVNSKT